MDWRREDISEIYNTPLMELSHAAVSFPVDPW